MYYLLNDSARDHTLDARKTAATSDGQVHVERVLDARQRLITDDNKELPDHSAGQAAVVNDENESLKPACAA